MKIAQQIFIVPLVLGTLLFSQPCHAWWLFPTKRDATVVCITGTAAFLALHNYYLGQENRLQARADQRAAELSEQLRLESEARAAEAHQLQEQIAAAHAQRAAEAQRLQQQLREAEKKRSEQAQAFLASMAALQETNADQHEETRHLLRDGGRTIYGAIQRLSLEVGNMRQDVQRLTSGGGARTFRFHVTNNPRQLMLLTRPSTTGRAMPEKKDLSPAGIFELD